MKCFPIRRWENAWRSCFLSDCVAADGFDLAVSSDVECVFFAVLSSEFQLNPSVSQTPSFSEKRGTSGTVSVCKRPKRARMNVERPPVKAVLESIRRRPIPQALPCKAVPECMRSTPPPPPEGTPLQIRPTWLVPPQEPAAEEEAM